MEFVFGIRLRVELIFGGEFVFAIRLRNSSSSAGVNVIPAQQAQCLFEFGLGYFFRIRLGFILMRKGTNLAVLRDPDVIFREP